METGAAVHAFREGVTVTPVSVFIHVFFIVIRETASILIHKRCLLKMPVGDA
jgi:hypothetical protein